MAEKKRPKAANGDGSLRLDKRRGMWVARVSYHAPDGTIKRLKAEAKDRGIAAQKFDKLKARKAELERGLITPGEVPTVGAWLDHWLTNIHGDEVRPGTREFYERAIRLYIKPHLGDKRLDRLTPDHVRTALRTVRKTSSSRNAQKAYQVLNLALNRAVRDRRITNDANPMLAVDKPQHTPQERDALPAEVALRIIEKAVEIDAHAPTGALLASRWAAAFWTGARQGEILGLTWDRVDLDGATLDFAWQLQQLQQEHGCGERTENGWPCGVHRPGHCPQRRWNLPPGLRHHVLHRSLVLTPPKSKAGTRVVPIAKPLGDMLRAHRKATADERNPHNLVWHYRDGRPINPRDDYTEWKRVLRAADVITDGETVPLHIARHTTASLLLKAGVDPRVIRDMIGHSTVVMTQAYQHVDLALAHDAMDRLSALLS